MSDEATIERVARAIYDAEPTIRVQVRVPRTTADFTSSLEIRNVPWSALDECDPHEKSAMVTSRNLARAAIAALGDGWQDIASAPRTGIEIDLWFSDDADAFYGGYRICNCWWSIVDDYWYGPRGAPARHLGNQAGKLTHWRHVPSRPLPPPPGAKP